MSETDAAGSRGVDETNRFVSIGDTYSLPDLADFVVAAPDARAPAASSWGVASSPEHENESTVFRPAHAEQVRQMALKAELEEAKARVAGARALMERAGNSARAGETPDRAVAVLHLAAILIPRQSRRDWLEEHRGYLTELPGSRDRLMWLLSLVWGLPALIVAMRFGPRSRKESA